MELIFELLSHPSLTATQEMRKRFDEKGGVIGRNADCTWQVVDGEQKVSKYHVTISYLDGAFFITDTSTNGVEVNGTGTYLVRDKPERIWTAPATLLTGSSSVLTCHKSCNVHYCSPGSPNPRA